MAEEQAPRDKARKVVARTLYVTSDDCITAQSARELLIAVEVLDALGLKATVQREMPNGLNLVVTVK